MFVPNELMNVKYEKSNINEPRSINLFKKKKKTDYIYSIKITTCSILLKLEKKNDYK